MPLEISGLRAAWGIKNFKLQGRHPLSLDAPLTISRNTIPGSNQGLAALPSLHYDPCSYTEGLFFVYIVFLLLLMPSRPHLSPK